MAGCAHKFNRAVSEHDAQEDRTEWKTAATAEKNERKTETVDSNQRQMGKGRARVTKPDGTKIEIDWDWVNETAERVRAHAETDSSSASTAQGEAQRKKEHGHKANTGGSTSLGPPWWAWPAAIVLLAVVVYVGVRLRRWWRARTLPIG